VSIGALLITILSKLEESNFNVGHSRKWYGRQIGAPPGMFALNFKRDGDIGIYQACEMLDDCWGDFTRFFAILAGSRRTTHKTFSVFSAAKPTIRVTALGSQRLQTQVRHRT